uniref:Uncharacterized protein n=1 Tax=Euglena hiemalis TaxID=392896 RepID=A0A345UC42_9EUGL|nr:hypothetical protein [Euglena hiemalis]AXI98028.1 hypothetical protein [Euglena hiemalis]
MVVRINKNIIRIPFLSENNMEAIKDLLISNDDFSDDIILKYLYELLIGFIITNAIITLVAQISIQYKNHENKIIDSQIQQLESVKYYYKVLTRNKSCIFFRNCIAVIESIIITIDDYSGLNADQRRNKFLEEVEILNSSGIPARLLAKPNKETIVMHRKAMTLRIRSHCQADPIYKKRDLLTTSKLVWNKLHPEQFVIFFEQYTNINVLKILKIFYKKHEFQDVNFLLADTIFSLFNSDEIEFNEFIGLNTVPFETFILQFSKKRIIRLTKIYKLNLFSDLKGQYHPLGNILEIQSQKLQQPGGLKSKKRFKK